MQPEDQEEEEEQPFDPLPDDYWKVVDAEGTEAVDLDALAATLRAGEPRACAAAIEVFVRLGQEAVPVLRALLEEDDPDVKIDAANALAQIEGDDAGDGSGPAS